MTASPDTRPPAALDLGPSPGPDAGRALLERRDGVARLLARRRALGVLGGALGAAVFLDACNGGDGDGASTATAATGTTGATTPAAGSTGTTSGASTGSTTSSGTTTTTTTTTTASSCTTAAQETAGPFPADGSNTNNGVLVDEVNNALIRSDVRADTDGTDTRPGIPLTLNVTVQNKNGACAALAGVWVYIWHCSRDGNYSGYSGSMNGGDFSANSFLRGVQQTDSAGTVSFTTIYPGRYEGRATHIHAAVFPANAAPNFDASTKLSTTQFCFPDATNNEAYASSGYTANQTRGNKTNASDNIFADGTATELLTVTGSPTAGYAASISIAVAA